MLFFQTVRNGRSVCGFSTKIEVECRSLTEALDAAAAGADVVMLDNFEPKVTKIFVFQLCCELSNTPRDFIV